MKKLFLCVFIFLTLTSCSEKKDELYYINNPKILNEAVNMCQNHQSSELDCPHISAIALVFQREAQQLRLNPQQYGMKITELQNEIVALKNDSKSEKIDVLREKQKELQLYLSIVKVFESPEH